MELTVARHCVSIGEDGLSPLQRALIEHPCKVRIAEAPTGAGKSYAFQRALRDHDQRILFIVPTRRLAQNLASGLIQDLIRQDGWSERRAEGSVALWSADQTAALKEQGVVNINGVRLRQMQALRLGNSGGEMIVAVPEVVSALLVRRRVEQGQAGKGVFDLLDDFDHIVFDEFHTIEARGFGLAALFARLATVELDHRTGYGRARISFLSATPLDLRPTLARVGVSEKQTVLLREKIVPDGRPLHGDVRLCLIDTPSLYDLILQYLGEIVAELAEGRQVVVIYNSLANLEKDLLALTRALPDGGIDPARVLVVNSVRDSITESLHKGGFAIGRRRDPLAYDLILATASVEIGVTFRNADFMLMEPGFEAVNFLQRYGRAARRGADGCVIVRLDEGQKRRKQWLRTLASWVEEHANARVSIEELTDVLSQSVQTGVAGAMADGAFGRLSARAVWCTGLYWSVLLDHPSNRGHRRQHLFDHRPPGVSALHRMEQDVNQLADEPGLAEQVGNWLRLFHSQVFDLRTIEPKIRVVIADTGEAFNYPRIWLERETLVFERGTLIDEEIHIQGSVDDYWREDDERDQNASRTWTCHFPHTERVQTLPLDERLIERWCRALEDIDPYGVDWDDYPEALEATRKLIRLTGLVPGHDPDIPVEAVQGVL